MTTLVERIIGNGDAALGQWERDESWTKTQRKLAELLELRQQQTERLAGARAAQVAAATSHKRIAAAVLVGDETDKGLRAAQREASDAEARVARLEADLEATDTAIQTLKNRLPELEREARHRHVEQVVRPWIEPLMAEFVPAMKRAAELSTRIAQGFKAVEEAFPVDTYAPSPDRFKPVNSFREEGTRELLNFSWADLGMCEEGAQFGTPYSRSLAKVRQAGYDK
jgi:hypothetical protein